MGNLLKRFQKVLKILILLLTLTYFGFLFKSSVYAVTYPAIYKSVCNSVNIRSGPSASYGIITQVNIGDTVTVVGVVS